MGHARSTGPESLLLRRKRFWFGLLVSLAFLAVFLYRTDFTGISKAFGQADYALALASVPLYFLGFWLRTIRWRLLLRPVADVTSLRLYPIVLIGLMANNVLPARVGEIVRAYLVGERESVSKSSALGTIAVDRVFDGLTLVAILGAVTAFSGSDARVTGIGVGTAGLFAGAAGVLVLLAFSPGWGKRWLFRLLSWLPARLEATALRPIDAFLEGLGSLRSPSALLQAGALSFLSWLTEAAMYYIVGQAFSLDVGFHVYLLITAAANLALSVLASPGGVGPFEVTTQAILIDLFSVPEPTASAYAIVLHAILLAPVIVVGFALLWAAQLSLSEALGGQRLPPAKALPAPPTVE